MIQCPYCERGLSSEGSYRVHKHRFHKGLEYMQPIVLQEEGRQPLRKPIENEPTQVDHEETPEPLQDQPKPQEPEHHGRSVVERGKGGDDGLAIIGGLGAIAVVIILALLGKKQ